MPNYNRGGQSLKVGDIGRLACLRQHLLLPGERMNTTIKGNVRMSGLRQQTSVYLSASLEAFAAPLRWYMTNFPTYLQEGVSTAITIPTMAAPVSDQDHFAVSHLGIGAPDHTFAKWFIQHPIKVHNEHYRWPEDAKASVTTPLYTFFANMGPKCVNLPNAATRMHDAPAFDASEYQVGSATVLDVRDLELWQARFKQASQTDWTSQERYNVFMKDIFGASGSNEVDQVPTRLRKGANIGVTPRDLYAQDGPSMGEIMSINNFNIDHTWKDYVAPEHMIVSYHLLMRFAPVMEDGVAPGIHPDETNYAYYQGDPEVLANHKPVAVASREIDAQGDGTTIGYLPSGWQWREGHNHVDWTIRNLGNFPLLDNQPQTAAGYRDASTVNDAFRSVALRHWFADLAFTINVDSRIAPAGSSIVAGSDTGRGPKGNHPTGGYLM